MNFFDILIELLTGIGTFFKTIVDDIVLMADYVYQALSSVQSWYAIIPAIFLPGVMAIVGVGVVLRVLDLI